MAKLIIKVFEKSVNEETEIKVPLSLAKTLAKFIPSRFIPILNSCDIDLRQTLEQASMDNTPRTLFEVQDSEDRIVVSIA